MPTILNTLGSGSGIDTARLISDLTAAQRGQVDATLHKRSESNAAQVSALAAVRSGLDAFVNALGNLTTGGDLTTQPESANVGALGIARDLSVPVAAPVDATIVVQQLATVQTVVSDRYTSAAAPVGLGTLTLTLGTLTASGGVPSAFASGTRTPVGIAITAANNSLTGLRDSINAAKVGVTASILDDGQGARLVLRGTSGATSGFTLAATPAGAAVAGDPSLDSLAFAPGANSPVALVSAAANARLSVDGVAIERTTNQIADALPGYTLSLHRADAATPVQVRAARDDGLLKQTVSNYVAAYNAMMGVVTGYDRGGTNASTAGPLYGQSAIRGFEVQLSALSARAFGGTTLAALGIQTARDGTLSVDDATLSTAIAADPARIETIFTGSGTGTDKGIAGAVKAMRDGLTASGGGFATYSKRLTQDATTIARDTGALDTRTSAYSAKLAKQFAAMEAAVAAYKSTGSFLTQQIDVWTGRNNRN